MGEVINVSSGPNSNNVLTHLYNVQESHIPYLKNAQVKYNNLTFLTAFKNKNGSVNYSPRALLFEFKDGLGSLNKYEYHEKKPVIGNIDPEHIIHTGKRLEKSEYQTRLDQGKSVNLDLLNSENTKYWVDYNKLIYQPHSINTLDNWELPSPNSDSQLGSHKHFHNMKFGFFNQGVEEFQEDSEDRLEHFRKLLENVDLLQGINLFTELDSAWGGFTQELIVQLQDEYFNSNSKKQIWTWSFSTSAYKPKLNQLYSRIQTFVELAASSSIFLPMNLDINSPLLSHVILTSKWQTSSIYSVAINSLWELNSQLSGPINMTQLEDGLIRGTNSKRNIVNEFRLNEITRKPKPKANQFGIIDVDLSAYYQTASLNNAPKASSPSSENSIDFSYGKPDDIQRTQYFSTNYIVPSSDPDLDQLTEGSNTNIYHNDNIGKIGDIDTFPKSIYNVPLSDVYVKFGINNNLKEELKLYRKIISGMKRETEIIEDKSELIETISDLIDEYTTGYEDESDEEFN